MFIDVDEFLGGMAAGQLAKALDSLVLAKGGLELLLEGRPESIDPYPSRTTGDRLRAIIGLVVTAGAVLIEILSKGIYSSKAKFQSRFSELCRQSCLMTCDCYMQSMLARERDAFLR